jgi:hypothetical protein
MPALWIAADRNQVAGALSRRWPTLCRQQSARRGVRARSPVPRAHGPLAVFAWRDLGASSGARPTSRQPGAAVRAVTAVADFVIVAAPPAPWARPLWCPNQQALSARSARPQSCRRARTARGRIEWGGYRVPSRQDRRRPVVLAFADGRARGDRLSAPPAARVADRASTSLPPYPARARARRRA